MVKYIFNVKSGYGSSLVEWNTLTLDTTFVSKEYVIHIITEKSDYYENAKISRGLLKIDEDFIMPDFETQVDGYYIKHIKGVLYTLDTNKRLIKLDMRRAGKEKYWVVCKKDNIFFESCTTLTRSRDCNKVELLGTDVKTLEQARRIILLRG